MPSNSVFSDFVVRARDQFTGPLRNMQRGTTAFSRNAQNQFGNVSRSMDRMRNAMRFVQGALIGGAAVRAGSWLVNQARGIEDATARFQPLLGSVENATAAVRALNETAASTPFQFEQLADSASTLLGFGAATQDTLVPTLRMLGDTAGGSADRLNGITLAFSQIQAGGKATLQDVNQLINNGIPILGELADMWGVTVGQAREMVSAGRATSDEVTAAFRRMTSEGGRFYRGMDIASQTTSGIFSTLKDNVSLTGAAIGTALLPTVKDIAENLIGVASRMREWVELNQDLINQRMADVISGIGGAVAFVGRAWDSGLLPALGAGIIAFKTVNALVAIGQGLMVAWAAASASAAAAGGGLAAVVALLGGPITLITAGIAGLTAAIVYLIRNWDRLSERFNNSNLGKWLAGNQANLDAGATAQRNAGLLPGMVPGASGNARTLYGGISRNINTIENRSTVDVNFGNLPSGASVRQTGRAPGVNLNLGIRAATISP